MGKQLSDEVRPEGLWGVEWGIGIPCGVGVAGESVVDARPHMRRSDSTGGATAVLMSRAAVPPVQHSSVLGESQNPGLEDAVRVRRPVSLQYCGVADVEVESLSLTAVSEDLVVRVAYGLILQFP